MRACGSAGEHAPAHGRPSTAPPTMFERVGIPDVFALDHSGAGILRLRHRRADPWVLTNPSAASKSLMPTGAPAVSSSLTGREPGVVMEETAVVSKEPDAR